MKYEYKGTTGNTEIEIDEHFYEILVSLDREEFNSDRKHSRRNPISLEGVEYEGEWFADGTDLLGDMIRGEESVRLNDALALLTPVQQELVQQIYFDGVPPSEIARHEGVDKSAISHRLDRVHKRLKKYLK